MLPPGATALVTVSWLCLAVRFCLLDLRVNKGGRLGKRGLHGILFTRDSRIFTYLARLTLERISGKEIWCEREKAEILGKGQAERAGDRLAQGGRVGWGTVCLWARMCRPRPGRKVVSRFWQNEDKVSEGFMGSQARGTTQKPFIVQPPGDPVTSNPFQVAGCKCDANTFGRFCERPKDLCEEQCFQNVKCIPGKGCEDCPLNMTGDGRHCAGQPGTGPWQEVVLGTDDTLRAQHSQEQTISFPFPAVLGVLVIGGIVKHEAKGEEMVQV